jgi:hypothetical protein
MPNRRWSETVVSKRPQAGLDLTPVDERYRDWANHVSRVADVPRSVWGLGCFLCDMNHCREGGDLLTMTTARNSLHAY